MAASSRLEGQRNSRGSAQGDDCLGSAAMTHIHQNSRECGVVLDDQQHAVGGRDQVAVVIHREFLYQLGRNRVAGRREDQVQVGPGAQLSVAQGQRTVARFRLRRGCDRAAAGRRGNISPADGALKMNLSAQQAGQLPADGKTQSGSSVFSAGGSALRSYGLGLSGPVSVDRPGVFPQRTLLPALFLAECRFCFFRFERAALSRPPTAFMASDSCSWRRSVVAQSEGARSKTRNRLLLSVAAALSGHHQIWRPSVAERLLRVTGVQLEFPGTPPCSPPWTRPPQNSRTPVCLFSANTHLRGRSPIRSRLGAGRTGNFS